MSKFLNATLAASLALAAAPALAGDFGLGRPALPAEIAAWDVDVTPDGTGLPEGSGDVWTGEEVFVAKCGFCHGDFAEGVGNWPMLAGGMDTLANEGPVKTVGSYWPYLSTAWDYVHRSMPFGDAQSLTDDEVYAIVAYMLYSNFLVDDDFVLSKENFLEVEMPNAEGFIVDNREEAEAHFWGGDPCMENCKDTVEITMRARVLDVTPEVEEEEAEELAAEIAPTAEAEEQAEEASAQEALTEAKEAIAETEAEAEIAAADPELIAAGENVFRKCKACHQVGEGAKNRAGPMLNNIVGAPAGAVEGFRYSKPLAAMAEEGLVWTEENLIEFLVKPRDFIKGTKMSFAGIKDEEDLAALIAYLGSFHE